MGNMLSEQAKQHAHLVVKKSVFDKEIYHVIKDRSSRNKFICSAELYERLNDEQHVIIVDVDERVLHDTRSNNM